MLAWTSWSALSHYLNLGWIIVNWTLRNKFQWNFNQNSYIFIQENAFEKVVWKMAAILSRPQCVNRVASDLRCYEAPATSLWCWRLGAVWPAAWVSTYRVLVMHTCVGNLTIIGSDNCLSHGQRKAIILTNATILLIGPIRKYFSENLIGIHTFSFKKMHLKRSSAKWGPFCLSLNGCCDILWEIHSHF